MKIATVVGARPQFIKCSAVSSHLRKEHLEILIHTGQHYDDEMSGQFFRELDLPTPDYNLGVGSGSHATQTAAMLVSLEEVFQQIAPDVVLLYGDTNSTLAAALAAAKLHLPIAHVEAGLRSYNRHMPEEINRVVADHLSAVLFCPTKTSVTNLTAEGISRGVHDTGDVMYDAALRYAPSEQTAAEMLGTVGVDPGHYYLATVHRAENTDNVVRMTSLLRALASLDHPVLLPLHPRTSAAINRYGLALSGALRPCQPLGYRAMLAAERHALAVFTDSGGVQKEAFFFGTPCVTLRDETEWVETVQNWGNVLVGADEAAIRRAAHNLPRATPGVQPFGAGNAGQLIANLITGPCSPQV